MDIFKLVGSVFVDTEEANKSLAKTDEKAEGVGKKLVDGAAKAGKFAMGLGAAAAAGATALMGVATKSAETADEIDKMSQKMGISKQGYQEWSYVMGQNGMDISTLNTGMKTLVNQMESAANGSAAASSYFDQLGISIYDANGNLKDQETIMNEAIYALADVEDMTLRSALATDLFGKAGTEMLPMLNSGSEGMQELTQRAHDLGLVMSDEAVNSGVVFGDTLDDVKQSFGMILTTIGSELMPVITELMNWVLDNMPTIQSVLSEVFEFIKEAVSIVIELIQAFSPLLEEVFAYIIDLWNTLLKPVLYQVIDFFANIFSGNIKGAFENLVNIIKLIWDKLVDIIKVPINSIITMINKFVSGIVGGINSVINAFNCLKIDVPEWVTALTGMSTFGFNIPSVEAPQIPLLAEGGEIVNGGSVIVGEAGAELIELPTGAKVTPLSNGDALGSNTMIQKMDEMLEEMRAIRNEMYGTIASALNGVSIDWDDRNLGRLVRTYAG